MSIIELPVEGNMDSVKYGHLRLDKELNIVSYTDYAKEFYGSIHHANFVDLAYDDRSREEYLPPMMSRQNQFLTPYTRSSIIILLLYRMFFVKSSKVLILIVSMCSMKMT